MHKIKEITNFNIFFNISFIIALMSNSYIIPYNLAARIFFFTCLYFIEEQYIILALLIILVR